MEGGEDVAVFSCRDIIFLSDPRWTRNLLVPRASELDARPTYRCRRSCHRHLSQIVEEAIRKTITALTFRRSRVFLRIRVEVTSE